MFQVEPIFEDHTHRNSQRQFAALKSLRVDAKVYSLKWNYDGLNRPSPHPIMENLDFRFEIATYRLNWHKGGLSSHTPSHTPSPATLTNKSLTSQITLEWCSEILYLLRFRPPWWAVCLISHCETMTAASPVDCNFHCKLQELSPDLTKDLLEPKPRS